MQHAAGHALHVLDAALAGRRHWDHARVYTEGRRAVRRKYMPACRGSKPGTQGNGRWILTGAAVELEDAGGAAKNYDPRLLEVGQLLARICSGVRTENITQ